MARSKIWLLLSFHFPPGKPERNKGLGLIKNNVCKINLNHFHWLKVVLLKKSISSERDFLRGDVYYINILFTNVTLFGFFHSNRRIVLTTWLIMLNLVNTGIWNAFKNPLQIHEYMGPQTVCIQGNIACLLAYIALSKLVRFGIAWFSKFPMDSYESLNIY